MKPTIVNVYLVRGGDEWALIDTGMNSADSIATFHAVAGAGRLRAGADCARSSARTTIPTTSAPRRPTRSSPARRSTCIRAEYERSQHFLPSDRPAEAVRFFLAHGIPLQRFVHVPRPSDIWGGLYVTDGARRVHRRRRRDRGRRLRASRSCGRPATRPGHCVMYLRGATRDDRRRPPAAEDHAARRLRAGHRPATRSADFLDSQRKVQRFDVDLVLPAHGGVFPDHRHRANQIIQHHQVRLQDMLDIVRRTAAHGLRRRPPRLRFDSDSPLTYQFPATFETLAHLEYLRHAGDVVDRGTRRADLLARGVGRRVAARPSRGHDGALRPTATALTLSAARADRLRAGSGSRCRPADRRARRPRWWSDRRARQQRVVDVAACRRRSPGSSGPDARRPVGVDELGVGVDVVVADDGRRPVRLRLIGEAGIEDEIEVAAVADHARSAVPGRC